MDASIPDLLRLVAVPVFGWAAWRDVKTRRVPNRTWLPLLGLGALLVLWEGLQSLGDPGSVFLLKVALSVGFIVPIVTVFWWMGSFGGADAKAFYVIAVLFPAYPTYDLGLVDLPGIAPTFVTLPPFLAQSGIFSLTILTNTVVMGMAYPLSMALINLVQGNVGMPMLIGRPVSWDRTTDEYGLLLETPRGLTRGGLDLDALRMYLQWRGISLAEVREDPDTLRDPDTLPAEPNPPGDGSIGLDWGFATDGGVDEPLDGDDELPPEDDEHHAHEDPWGARAFLEDIGHGAYGTTPAELRDGLDVLAARDEVWISPGIPFLVPTFFGLLTAILYGDLLMTFFTYTGVV